MDIFKQGMKGPTRPAPTIPGPGVTRYSPVTNWNNDPFEADLFEPTPTMQKKKPPPRPPPPKVTTKQPDVPAKPSHFIRRPTVLSSLLTRKNKSVTNPTTVTHVNSQPKFVADLSEIDATRMFPKCEPKNIQTGALIDLSSPPSSPTLTTRSSSDGLSVDSFGSDATTSTSHQNHHGGNASQAESGFEDDFDLFMNTRKISKDDTMENFSSDPFSPQPMIKPPIMKKPVLAKDPYEMWSQSKPTIIRAKPARPKPPENSALLKNTFGGSFSVTPITLNTTTPIQKINGAGGFGDSFDTKPFSWNDDRSSESPERESSPPMPSIPPPPPPDVTDDDVDWGTPDPDPEAEEDNEPYGIALFDYFTDHKDDLYFSVNTKIKLIRRVDNEWLYGSLKNGTQGTFPSNYIEVKIPLPNEKLPSPSVLATATALYDFAADQPGDLRFQAGDTITVQYKINDEWYFGECNGSKGQFPINYVEMS